MGVFFIKYPNLALNRFFSYLAQIYNPKILVRMCKKPTNRTNRSKPIELLPNFQFGFSFEFLKPKIFNLVFGGRFECIEPTEPNYIIIYFINIWAFYMYLGFSFCLKTFGPFFF